MGLWLGLKLKLGRAWELEGLVGRVEGERRTSWMEVGVWRELEWRVWLSSEGEVWGVSAGVDQRVFEVLGV